MKFAATLVLLCWSIAANAQSTPPALQARPLTKERAEFLRYLVPLVRWPSFKPDGVSVDARIKHSVDVWSYNPSDECTFDNHHPVCKSKIVYMLVYGDDSLEPARGIELGPSFGFDLTAIALQDGTVPCIVFQLNERVLVRDRNGAQMKRVEREICLTERGSVRR